MVVIWNTRILRNDSQVLLDFSSKQGHSDKCEDVEDGEEDATEIHKRLDQVPHCFNNYSHHFDFIEERQQLQHSYKDHQLQKFDDGVVLLCLILLEKVI